MRRKALIVLLIGLFVTPALALESPWEQKLPFKNATINYDVSGMSSGSKTIFINNNRVEEENKKKGER